ncbi:MAG TPA: DUF2852 domain-containing protein [Devosia sp.]|nr:DUF2852 domain-containing protein [Devosia sp.]
MNASNYAYFRPGWTPLTVLAMVLGFMIFWPLGLAVLAYILWGQRFGFAGERAERWINRQRSFGGWCRSGADGFRGWGQTSGNAAFDAYREEQLRRLDEERRRLDDEVHEFHEYLRNLHMARDREEFDRFLRERQSRQTGSNPPANPDKGSDIDF